MNRSATGEAVLAVVLGMLLVGLGSVFTETGPTNPDLRPSTYSNDRSGLRALFLILDDLGVEVSRLEDPIRADGDPGRTVVLAAPTVPFTDDEVLNVLDWTRSGGRLVVIGSALESPLATLGYDRLFEAAGFRTAGGSGKSDLTRPGKDWTGGSLPGWKGLEFVAWPTARTVRPLDDPAEDAGNDALLGEPKRLIEGDRGLLAVSRPVGEGQIVLLPQTRGFSNEALRWGDNALVAAALLLGEGGTKTRVVFDEFHHGFDNGRGRSSLGAALAASLTSTWPGRALLVLVGAGLVYLAGAAVRLGKADPGLPPRRRQLSEHANALGRLLEGSGSAREALGLLAAGVRRTVGPRVGLSPRLPPKRFRERLSTLEAPGAAELADVLKRAETPGAAGSRDFARIARDLARARGRFIHGRR